MTAAPLPHEGYVHHTRGPFAGQRTWYRTVGANRPGTLPLLCLHGGPGAPHDYLEPLDALARSRLVIFYDQCGCGNSDQPSNPELWKVPHFVQEVDTVRKALGLEKVHILGQSWGGMLGMEYALTQPAGLASLIVADSPASMTQWVEEANKLRAALPPDVQETLVKHEDAGTTDDPAYQAAVMVFYRRHLCRTLPWPACMQRAFMRLRQEVYMTMNGPSEFHVIGNLKDWDIRHRLGEIRVPTLILSGRHDEATPAIAETIHRGIPGSQWVLFEESSHSPHIEETDKYLAVVEEFLEAVERRG